MANRTEKSRSRDFIFLGSKITVDGDCSHEILRRLLLGRKAMTDLDHVLKSRDITLSTKVHIIKATVFQQSCVDVRAVTQGWALKTEALEKTLESPLDSKEIKPVNPKGNQPWIFTGRIDAEAPILWPANVKCWLRGKDPDAGKDWRQEEGDGRGWDG